MKTEKENFRTAAKRTLAILLMLLRFLLHFPHRCSLLMLKPPMDFIMM